MNRSATLLLLVCAQVGMSVVVAVLCYLQINATRTLGRQNARITRYQVNSQALNQLAVEAVEYSKRNPAIDQLLVSIGAKPSRAGVSTSAPPVKAAPLKP